MHTESNIDRKYRELLFRYYFFNPVLKQSSSKVIWESPCPFCSHRRPQGRKQNKKTGCLYWNEGWNSWTYSCQWNDCQYKNRGISFPYLIKALNEELFREYQLERYHAGTTGWQTNCPNPRDSVIPLPSKHHGKQTKSKNSRSQGKGSPRSNGNRRNPNAQGSHDNPTGSDAVQDGDQQGI